LSDLVIDYAWTRPSPAAIAAAGYKGVVRYLSTDPTKNLSQAEAQALGVVGLGVRCAWETTATRATAGGGAGYDDASAANSQADSLGYPSDVPLFYAVDEEVDPNSVKAYFLGAQSAGLRPVKGYGDAAICDALAEWGFGNDHWQTVAWSGGEVDTANAALYQRLSPTVGIPGVPTSDFDEDVCLRDGFIDTFWFPGKQPTDQVTDGLTVFATDASVLPNDQATALYMSLLWYALFLVRGPESLQAWAWWANEAQVKGAHVALAEFLATPEAQAHFQDLRTAIAWLVKQATPPTPPPAPPIPSGNRS
jgi:hypothetical protein